MSRKYFWGISVRATASAWTVQAMSKAARLLLLQAWCVLFACAVCVFAVATEESVAAHAFVGWQVVAPATDRAGMTTLESLPRCNRLSRHQRMLMVRWDVYLGELIECVTLLGDMSGRDGRPPAALYSPQYITVRV
jgi:hypothetical protein